RKVVGKRVSRETKKCHPTCRKALSRSAPRRAAACVAANGGWPEGRGDFAIIAGHALDYVFRTNASLHRIRQPTPGAPERTPRTPDPPLPPQSPQSTFPFLRNLQTLWITLKVKVEATALSR